MKPIEVTWRSPYSSDKSEDGLLIDTRRQRYEGTYKTDPDNWEEDALILWPDGRFGWVRLQDIREKGAPFK